MDPLTERVTLLKIQLREFYDATDELEEMPKWICDALRPPLCKVTLRVFPEAMTKMNEVVSAEEKNLKVRMVLHGHDLEDADGRRYEQKTSKVKITSKDGKRGQCNFHWNVPTGDDRRQLLIDSIDEKAKDGTAIFEVRNHMGHILASYVFTAAFMKEYFAVVPISEEATTINMGSTFCFACKTCPKLERLMDDQREGRTPNVTKHEKHICVTDMSKT